MPGLSQYSGRKLLEHITGKTAYGALPTAYVALFTTAPTAEDGTGAVEPSGGSYARVATSGVTWNAATGSAPASINNAATITFPTATANWGTVVAWGLYDAASGGNLLAWDWLGNEAWKPFAGSLASPSVLTSPAHGYSNADQVVVTAEFGGTLPATGGSWSGLLTVANATTDTFTAGVNATGAGTGMVRRVISQAVVTNVVVSFGASALTLTAA